ncbi:MAG: hypothetical protein FWF01_00035 [Alphaproteobacteria bacterium]|nr:hypothetical protein [Alphaproteobacteria bacterium]
MSGQGNSTDVDAGWASGMQGNPLLDFLQSMEPPDKQDWLAVLLRFGSLGLGPHDDAKIKRMEQLFQQAALRKECRFFPIHGSDSAVLYRRGNADIIDAMLMKAAFMFAADKDSFSKGYDLGGDFDALAKEASLLPVVGELKAAAKGSGRGLEPAIYEQGRLTPVSLKMLEDQIMNTDMAGRIRRSPVAVLAGESAPVKLFDMLGIPISEIESAIDPSLDLRGNCWLLQHIKELLQMAAVRHIIRRPRRSASDFGLDISVRQAQGEDFLRLESMIDKGARKSIVFNFDIVDIAADAKGWVAASQLIRQGGFRTAVRLCKPAALIDVGFLNPDFLFVPAEIYADGGEPAPAFDAERIIAHNVSDKQQADQAARAGIKMFCGEHINSLLKG